MAINVQEVVDFDATEHLLDARQTYDFEIVQAKEIKADKNWGEQVSLFIAAQVTKAPEQQDGYDPVEAKHEVVSNFVIDGIDPDMSDKGRRFLLKKSKTFLEAVLGEITGEEIEPQMLVGESFSATTRINEYQGEKRDEFDKFFAD